MTHSHMQLHTEIPTYGNERTKHTHITGSIMHQGPHFNCQVAHMATAGWQPWVY